MDQLAHYRHVIQATLKKYYERTIAQATSNSSEVSDRLVLDPSRDQYLWLRFGWNERQREQHIIMYLCLKNGKIWVEEDATDLCMVDDLLAAGIPPADIVLGFHPPIDALPRIESVGFSDSSEYCEANPV
jgi:hypothetical protein